VLLAACSRGGPSSTPFAIVRTSPPLHAQAAPLLLNDAITVYFSADVLPVSVTADSVTLVDGDDRVVPGTLRVGANWVSFVPVPPVTRELDDGSYRPGASYRLLIAGSPRPDAVRATDERRLAAATAFPVRIASLNDAPEGLPAPLRPQPGDVPLLLRADVQQQQLPADRPRLRLHFTQPLLPASVTPAAFQVTVLVNASLEEIVPRRAYVVPSRLDAVHGSTVELDLGAWPTRARDGSSLRLREKDLVCVELRRGEHALRDYAGNAALPAEPQLWTVVAGDNVALAEWPSSTDAVFTDDALGVGFEVRGDVIRPRVRVEAGDGSLGVFRPRRDTTLRPNEPFDRGDGTLVVSRGTVFPFASIDVPAGVTVRLDGGGTPVHLLACGSVRVDGRLELAGPPRALPRHLLREQPVRELLELTNAALVAAGDITIGGAVVAAVPPAGDTTSLLLAAAGAIDLRGLAGELPFHTLLAREANGDAAGSILGVRGQSLVLEAGFTYGVPPGADLAVRGVTTWRQLPWDRDAGAVHLVDASDDLQLAWQAAPADPVHRTQPDLSIGRVSRLEPVLDGATIAVAAGSFVRFALQARVRAGIEPPRLRELRLCDR
jgi:hypothetical protein